MAKIVDLRTYLLLERAFVRRLQRSWRQKSALTYAKITQACLEQKWGEARRLVPDLDMAEVGTENREWIQYMLLSCAVFGAGTVRKGKPSFVGVGTFDTFLKQVTNNFLMYLEYSATAQVQEEALQSIAEDEAKTKSVLKWDESKHPRDKDGQFTEGVGYGATQTPQPHAGAGGGGGVAVPSSPAPAKGRPDAVPEASRVANAYNAAHGFPPVVHGYVKVDEVRAGNIADAYDAMPATDLDNPAVREAYAALSTEIQAQWDHIIASGMTFTPWTKEGQPYQNSTEMAEDVRTNKRLYFFTGGEVHPLMGEIDPKTGLSMNDKFRAVHDYFGHAAGGYGFGPRGEENAWVSHSQMLTPQARRALTTETRGQNSWVNFGKQNYHSDGTHKNIPPADRPFATQKVALLPEQYMLMPGETSLKWDEAKHPRDKEGQFTATGATEVLDVTDPEGSGPERVKWRTLSREAGETFEAFMEAKTAHRANVNKATDKLEAYSKTHPDASVEEIEAEIWSDPEYLKTKKIAQAAERAKSAADARLAAQEPEMKKEIVRNVAYGVAVEMGVDPYIISVVHKDPPAFMVGEKQFREAGHYAPASKLIELNAKEIPYADTPTVKGIVAHEVSHFIYHRLKDDVEREVERYKMKANHYHDTGSEWFYERFDQPHRYGPRTLKPEWRERVEQEFPASAVWSKLSGGEMFTGISDEMKAENGHSAYAKSYWQKSAVNAAGSYDKAINETVAEDTRFLLHEKNKGKGGAGWHEPSKPSPDSQWLAFTKAMHTWYTEGNEWRRAGVERIRAEYAKRKAI